MITLTDAELAFADTTTGKLAIAYAHAIHDLEQGHLGRRARPWNDEDRANAIRAAMTEAARADLGANTLAAGTPDLRAASDAALAAIDHNAWRKAG